jgi:hypothetical protein
MIVESPEQISCHWLPTGDTVCGTGNMAVMAVRTLDVEAALNPTKQKTD